MLRRWLFGDQEFASFHLPSEWAGKGGAETYAIGPDARARMQELHSALVRANPEEPNAVRDRLDPATYEIEPKIRRLDRYPV